MSKISQKYVRRVMKEYAGNNPVSKEVIVYIRDYLDRECHRICKTTATEYRAKVELRKIQKIRPHHRIGKEIIEKVV
jgi:hypothetical protein